MPFYSILLHEDLTTFKRFFKCFFFFHGDVEESTDITDKDRRKVETSLLVKSMSLSSALGKSKVDGVLC